MAATIGLKDTVLRWLINSVMSESAKYALEQVMLPQADLDSCQMLNSAGLVIHGASSKVAKTGASDTYLIAKGILEKIAASTDMPALSGTVTNAKFNVFCFDIDSAGNVTSTMGVEGADLAHVVFPPRYAGQTRIGFIIINPTGTGNFVGGTTNLDDATVVPNAVYVSPTGSWDPSILAQ